MKNLKGYALSVIVTAFLITCVITGCSAGTAVPGEGTSPAADEKVTITDLAGRTVVLKKDIQRIVLLRSKDIYQLAALLGDELPKRLVAWGPDLKKDDNEGYKKITEKYPELINLPESGDVYDEALSPEQVMKFKPDLVIMDKFLIDGGYKYVEKFEASGLPCIYTDETSDPLKGPQNSIALLGKVLGKEERGNEILQFANEKIDSVLTRIDKLTAPPPSVYLEQGNTGPSKFGATYGGTGNPKKYNSWGAILKRLKVNNIADGVASGQVPINPEYVLRANPDLIVITGQNWTAVPDSMKLGYYSTPADAQKLLNGFLKRPGWSGLNAVENKRIYSVFHATSQVFIFSCIEALAKYCYPEEFKDLNPEKDLKEYYDRFMPISYSGIWMLGIS